LPVLEHRSRTDKGIFYSHGGLPRAERELAATVTSKVNGCIYCASVHARKAAQLSGEVSAVDALLAVAPGADLAASQTPRWQAQIRLAAQLAATPQAANASHLAALRAMSLSELELLDLVGAVAFFSWANRLMLTLGEPFLLVA
jgi:alkylhydroperoxidase domain protein